MIHSITLGIMLFSFTFFISQEFRYLLFFSLTELISKIDRIIEEEERRSKR